jgi:hypothetical protein
MNERTEFREHDDLSDEVLLQESDLRGSIRDFELFGLGR